ncbi:hypothetical protein H9P43_005753 [Blastocladiella emersonii ATCC 22665]|nr:hypothetical protein H9P43_005753 [Blastocladiella emersonii ATCC 22665]
MNTGMNLARDLVQSARTAAPRRSLAAAGVRAKGTYAGEGPAPARPVDATEVSLRQVMRHQAFPVCVVGSAIPPAYANPHAPGPLPAWASGLDADGAWPRHRMATLSSFTSVSLSPPIVSFALRHPSRMGDVIAHRGDRRFLVHLLAADQAGVSQRFADPRTQTEVGGDVQYWLHGEMPVLKGCLAVLECVAEKGTPVEVGDHTVWFGRVVRVLEVDKEKKPLLYVDRKYTTVEEA